MCALITNFISNQILAAACYLDLQDLCTACTDFIVEDMRDPDHFLDYYDASKLF